MPSFFRSVASVFGSSSTSINLPKGQISANSSGFSTPTGSTDQLPMYAPELPDGEQALPCTPQQEKEASQTAAKLEQRRQEVLFVDHKIEQAMKMYGW